MAKSNTRATLFGYWVGAHVGTGMAWGMAKAIVDFEVEKRQRASRHLRNPDIWEPVGSDLSETGSLLMDVAAYGVFGAVTGGIIGGVAPISYPLLAHHWWPNQTFGVFMGATSPVSIPVYHWWTNRKPTDK
jgi:hypothetical protein